MKYYEVWRQDTFAGEDYFCGRYLTRQEAVEACKKRKKSRKHKTKKYEIHIPLSSLPKTKSKNGKKNKTGLISRKQPKRPST